MFKHYLPVIAVTAFLVGAQAQSAAGSSTDQPPLLTPAQMAQQTIKCKPRKIDPGLLPKGTIVSARVTVNEAGEIVDLNFVEHCPVGCGLLADAILSVKSCKFKPYVVDGKTIPYRGDVQLVAP